jgi:hypothetical protein
MVAGPDQFIAINVPAVFVVRQVSSGDIVEWRLMAVYDDRTRVPGASAPPSGKSDEQTSWGIVKLLYHGKKKEQAGR